MELINVCLYICIFCFYLCLIKKWEEGWEYSLEDILDIVKKYDGELVIEVYIVGGVLL